MDIDYILALNQCHRMRDYVTVPVVVDCTAAKNGHIRDRETEIRTDYTLIKGSTIVWEEILAIYIYIYIYIYIWEERL